MGGAGFVRASTKLAVFGATLIDSHDVVLAWQFGVGAGYALTDHVTLSGCCRYCVTTETDIQDAGGNAVNGECLGHSFELGIRFTL